MEDLPVEMIMEIMQYLHPKDIGKLSESSKYMHGTIKKNRKTHIYELPDEVLEKIFQYIVNATCLEGFNNTKLEKYKKYAIRIFATNLNFLRVISGMGGFAFNN